MMDNDYDLNGHLANRSAPNNRPNQKRNFYSTFGRALLQTIVMVMIFIRPLFRFVFRCFGVIGAVSFIALFILEPDIANYTSLMYFSLALSFLSFLVRWIYDGFILKYSSASLMLNY